MKRTLAWILAALLLCAAFACVKPAAETPADTSAETEAPAVPTEEPAAKPTEAVAGVPQDVIEERPREPILITDLIGREITVVPGSYQRVVCIGAGALRMFTYIADVGLLCGVEDIDNLSLAERPKMFDASARPYVLAYGDAFSELPSCGVGGPNAQAAEAEKILACEPDIVISEYEDWRRRTRCRSSSACRSLRCARATAACSTSRSNSRCGCWAYCSTAPSLHRRC